MMLVMPEVKAGESYTCPFAVSTHSSGPGV